jgi:beta-glucanase (GH16 family)
MTGKAITIVSILLVTGVLSGSGQDEWRLVWSDEFDTDGLPDPGKWTYEVGYVRNNEAQFYTYGRPGNARIENGLLIIEARKELFNGFEYTSASLTTRGNAEFTYGRVEVKAMLPSGRGMWPAIWMLGSNIDQVGWPACGEIDIMENVGYRKRRIHGHVHYHDDTRGKGARMGESLRLTRPWSRFYLYAIEWYEDRIDFFVDDIKYFTFLKGSGGLDQWPFDRPHYLLINLAVGGSWGGKRGIDDSAFPGRFMIEYVRVYERVTENRKEDLQFPGANEAISR